MTIMPLRPITALTGLVTLDRVPPLVYVPIRFPLTQNLFTYPVDVPPVPLLARPTSVDIERLDQYHQTVPPTQLRVRSPFAGASTPVSPIGPQTSGPLDHIPFGMDLPLRPLATRNIPVDLSVDARNATFSHSNSTSPSSSLGPDTSSPSHLVPPTITKTPISDEPL